MGLDARDDLVRWGADPAAATLASKKNSDGTDYEAPTAPATIADGADVAQGAKADAAAVSDTGTFSLVALFKRLLQKITSGLSVGGFTARPSATFTRPADTNVYASGDLVANSTTAGSVAPMAFTIGRDALGKGGMVRRVRLRKSGTSITNASFRLHLYLQTAITARG
jgi:hypothetical protein